MAVGNGAVADMVARTVNRCRPVLLVGNRAFPRVQQGGRVISVNTRFVCQAYRYAERGEGAAKRKVLVQASAIECKTSAEAEARAHRMFDGGSYAGTDAFSIEVDIELGDYTDPAFIIRLGDVPPVDT